jgi:hypothetical protein
MFDEMGKAFLTAWLVAGTGLDQQAHMGDGSPGILHVNHP